MARAFILSPKTSDRVITISASSSVSNAIVSNLLLQSPNTPWISQNSSGYVIGEFQSNISADTLFLGYTSAQGLREDVDTIYLPDTFRLRLADSVDNLISSPIFDSEITNPDGVKVCPENDLDDYLYPHRVWTFESQTFKAYRVDFNWSNPTLSVRASRLIIGTRIEPLKSVQPKWSIGGNEDVIESTDYSNEEDPRSIGVKRTMSVTWLGLTEEERDKIYSCLLERGSSRDIVLAIEPMEGLFSMSRLYVGRIKHAFSFEQLMMDIDNNESDQHIYNLSLTISELAPTEMR